MQEPVVLYDKAKRNYLIMCLGGGACQPEWHAVILKQPKWCQRHVLLVFMIHGLLIESTSHIQDAKLLVFMNLV